MDVCKLGSTNELVDHTEMVASRLYYRAHIFIHSPCGRIIIYPSSSGVII